MTVITSIPVENFADAADLALSESGVDGVSVDTMKLMSVVVDQSRLKSQAELIESREIRHRWAKASFFRRQQWWLGVPRLKYSGQGIPCLSLEIQAFVVASGQVRLPTGSSYGVAVVESVGKPEHQVLPLTVILSVAEGTHLRYPILEKDSQWITWNVVGFDTGIRVHGRLVEGICQALRYQTIYKWLRSFGPQGEDLAPHVVGFLLGVLSGEGSRGLLKEQTWAMDDLREVIKKLGYNAKETETAINRVLPELATARDMEEALRTVLKAIGS